jgi:hypothetical protein
VGETTMAKRKPKPLKTLADKIRFVTSMLVAFRNNQGKDREAIRKEVMAIAVKASEKEDDEYEHETLVAMCRRGVDEALDKAGP